jgi:hypothetical protein
VDEEVSSIPAIWRSPGVVVGPSLACLPRSVFKRRMRARSSIRAGASPERISFNRRSRSAFVSSTTYFLRTAAPFGIGWLQDTANHR